MMSIRFRTKHCDFTCDCETLNSEPRIFSRTAVACCEFMFKYSTHLRAMTASTLKNNTACRIAQPQIHRKHCASYNERFHGPMEIPGHTNTVMSQRVYHSSPQACAKTSRMDNTPQFVLIITPPNTSISSSLTTPSAPASREHLHPLSAWAQTREHHDYPEEEISAREGARKISERLDHSVPRPDIEQNKAENNEKQKQQKKSTERRKSLAHSCNKCKEQIQIYERERNPHRSPTRIPQPSKDENDRSTELKSETRDKRKRRARQRCHECITKLKTLLLNCEHKEIETRKRSRCGFYWDTVQPYQKAFCMY
jgi:hypothetical protein